MASAASVNTLMDAAVAALEAGDYATALTKLMAAKASLAAIPDSSKAGESLNYDRGSIDELIRQVRQQQTAASVSANGISTARVTYTRASCDD